MVLIKVDALVRATKTKTTKTKTTKTKMVFYLSATQLRKCCRRRRDEEDILMENNQEEEKMSEVKLIRAERNFCKKHFKLQQECHCTDVDADANLVINCFIHPIR